jgi:hypothetical protein
MEVNLHGKIAPPSEHCRHGAKGGGKGGTGGEDVNLYPRHGDSAVMKKSCERIIAAQ